MIEDSIEDIIEETEDIIEEEPVKEEITIEEIVKEEVLVKKPGRPKASKDKIPRPKRKPVIKEVEVEIPRAIENSLPIPENPTTDKYILMLELLNRQAYNRKNNKTDLWKSWFVR
jgi:hypothetical protein